MLGDTANFPSIYLSLRASLLTGTPKDLAGALEAMSMDSKVFMDETSSSLGRIKIVFRSPLDAECFFATVNGAMFLGSKAHLISEDASLNFTNTSGSRIIVVKHLSLGMRSIEFYRAVRRYGRIISCRVMVDRTGVDSFALLQFENQSHADQCISDMNGMSFRGSEISMSWQYDKNAQYHYPSQSQQQQQANRRSLNRPSANRQPPSPTSGTLFVPAGWTPQQAQQQGQSQPQAQSQQAQPQYTPAGQASARSSMSAQAPPFSPSYDSPPTSPQSPASSGFGGQLFPQRHSQQPVPNRRQSQNRPFSMPAAGSAAAQAGPIPSPSLTPSPAPQQHQQQIERPSQAKWRESYSSSASDQIPDRFSSPVTGWSQQALSGYATTAEGFPGAGYGSAGPTSPRSPATPAHAYTHQAFQHQQHPQQQPQQAFQPAPALDTKNLYIKNIPLFMKTEDLTSLFAPYGRITSARIMTNEVTGLSKGFGFVSYSTEEEAVNARLAMNGYMIPGCEKGLVVNVAEPKRYREMKRIGAIPAGQAAAPLQAAPSTTPQVVPHKLPTKRSTPITIKPPTALSAAPAQAAAAHDSNDDHMETIVTSLADLAAFAPEATA
ncbi:hypothetical protein HK105_202461 [Polyrhizophydium stewartii]|uniref:RRM domain-containing protein n=1 Tax=Polyrhizophydium stewartii TaxID=2732419 RepID=A0ABR4NEW2_9FUNG